MLREAANFAPIESNPLSFIEKKIKSHQDNHNRGLKIGTWQNHMMKNSAWPAAGK
jgi:hypothetical protein